MDRTRTNRSLDGQCQRSEKKVGEDKGGRYACTRESKAVGETVLSRQDGNQTGGTQQNLVTKHWG